MSPPIKNLAAEAKHEKFFASVVAAALENKLRDEEIAALIGKMLGYQLAFDSSSSTVPHLIECFRHNIALGYDEVMTGRVKPMSTT